MCLKNDNDLQFVVSDVDSTIVLWCRQRTMSLIWVKITLCGPQTKESRENMYRANRI